MPDDEHGEAPRTPVDFPDHRTIQIRSGTSTPMRTLTGAPVPAVLPPEMPLPRYELGEEIARGGMGRVVDATDTMLGRVVALKEALALDAESVRRFAREMKITARLEHPSIVPVHDAGTMACGAPFYVMRKVGGRPLEALVAAADTLNERLALIPHIIATAHAIAHAHERGIVHRDIKPSNILCGDLGETIVIDWGLAKVIGEVDEPTAPANIDPNDAVKTRAGIVFGTPGFMAPEQLRGKEVSPRSDVYALGATLYHLLSRKPPHHAKTADEMMKAAAHAPPTPIGDLVHGVPPELSTIVDKALAHDPKRRYQDARALAEDLARFLTGQLVASHRYSASERIVRFVRRHRGTVAVVGAALAALVIGGTIAVTRVVGERDRADGEAHKARASETSAREAQRRAEDRNEKLILQQARSKVTSNPTEAIAIMKPLARKQWREVRSIAAAARASGVAWSLPGPLRTESLEMSRDGRRVLVAGEDGSVRICDLERRTARILVAHGPALSARFADGERRIVVWRGQRLVVLDGQTGKQVTDVTVPSVIADLEMVGATAYWVDGDGKLWRLALADLIPLVLPVEEKLEQLAPSPDGKWLALRGANHLLLYELAAPPATAVQEVLFGKTRDLDWSDDGTHLAALIELGEPTERQVVDIAVTAAPQIVHKIRVGPRAYVAFSNGGPTAQTPRMYTLGQAGVGVASRSETTPRKQLIGEPIGVRESANGVVVAGSGGGLAILTDDGDHALLVPSGRLDRIDASARSPYVIGMIEGRMLVWNMAELLPRRLAVRTSTLERFIGNERVIAAFLDAPAELLDLGSPTAASRPLGMFPAGVLDIAGTPDGRAAAVIDLGHHAKLFVEAQEPEDLGSVDVATFATSTQLVLGMLAGSITRLDLQTKQRTTLVERDAKLVHLTASRQAPPGSYNRSGSESAGEPTSSPWIAAVFADGALWRMNLATGMSATTATAGLPLQILVEADGTVVFPEGRMLRSWRPEGSIEPLVQLPVPIFALGIAGADRAVAFGDGGTGYVVDLDVPQRHSEPFELYVQNARMSPESGLVVIANRGAIEVLDPIVPHRWTLASSPGLTFSTPVISGDGRHILARRLVTDREKKDVEARDVNVLLVWRLVLPDSAAETVAWLDALTNASVDPQTTNLAWQ